MTKQTKQEWTFDIKDEHLNLIKQGLYEVEQDTIKMIKLLKDNNEEYVAKLVEIGNLQRVMKHSTITYTSND